MMNWNAQLEAFFKEHEQEHPYDGEQSVEHPSEAAEFMSTVAMPAFEAFAAIQREHGRHLRLRRGDASIRILVEYADVVELDFTLWVGTNALSTELRIDGQRKPGGFQNARGTSHLADTTLEDVAQCLTNEYTVMNT